MPHYYFDLTDGFTRKDRNGMECVDDKAAIVAGGKISRNLAVATTDRSGPPLHVSVMNDAGLEVAQIPVAWPIPT